MSRRSRVTRLSLVRALWRWYAPGLRTASRNPLPELLKGHLFGAHQGEGI